MIFNTNTQGKKKKVDFPNSPHPQHTAVIISKTFTKELPAAFCPNVNEGFWVSEVDDSLLSTGLPKINAAGGCSVGALGLPKEKPLVAAAESASLLAAPKTKLDGAADASFFSSDFPKLNVEAAGSFPAGKDPNVELTFGVPVAKLGSPNLPNTDPFVEVVVVVGLAFVDVAIHKDSALSLFDCEEKSEVRETEDEVVVVVSGVFSAGFVCSKEKPLLEELLSVLDDPVPKVVPLPTPNLNPEPAAGCSDFLSSLEATPNLKPSEELPNLNPDEAVVSLEEDSDEELPNGTPNLNPPEEDDDGSEVPNLKPPDVEVEEPNVDVPVVPTAEEAKEPKAEKKQDENIYTGEKSKLDAGLKKSVNSTGHRGTRVL